MTEHKSRTSAGGCPLSLKDLRSTVQLYEFISQRIYNAAIPYSVTAPIRNAFTRIPGPIVELTVTVRTY